jgi:hypothetical protein
VASDRTKDSRIFRVALHADSIAQDGTSGKGAGRIDSQYTYILLFFAQFGNQRIS